MSRITVVLVAAAFGVTAFAQQDQQPPPQPPPQPPVFRSGTNVVRVDVSAIDKTGTPVTSLHAEDF